MVTKSSGVSSSPLVIVTDILILGGFFLSSSKVTYLLKSSISKRFDLSLSMTRDKAFIKLVFPALLCPIMTLTPSLNSISLFLKFLKLFVRV